MSAELVDPFAVPAEQLKAADMCVDITSRIATSQQNDPPLLPQLVQKTLEELLARAEGDPWARWLLEELHHRAVTRVPFGEPAEPAWSLDSEERHVPRGEGR